MNTITLMLHDATQAMKIDDIRCFVGVDHSGSFGILPGHARMMTALSLGLARFRRDQAAWQYLALPGALMYFCNNTLTITTRKYLIDDDYTRILTALREQLLKEEEEMHTMKESLHRMEKEVLKRLWEISRRGLG